MHNEQENMQPPKTR